ncbi:MAG: hypothetical protein AAFS10_19320, partial [Myxococcota bacterium]
MDRPPAKSLNVRLVELRNLLHAPPSPTAWRDLVALLDAWPTDAIQIAIDYASPHLEAWPTTVRFCPERWLQRIAQGDDEPRVALTRIGRLARTGDGVNDNQLERLANHPALAHITRLSLPNGTISPDGIGALVDSPHLQHLEGL